MHDASRRPELPKRFYRAVTIAAAEGGFRVLLDGRAVKTPARRLLAVPARASADVLAAEWDAQGEVIDPATMPMTRLVNTVIDGIADDPAPVRDDIARFAESDLLFYRARDPERLAARQRERWDPILRWAEARLGALFQATEGVMPVRQPEASLAAVRRRLSEETDPFRIAALHQATTLTGSALIALALGERRLSAEDAWSLAHLDEDWNVEQWGEDEEASTRRARRWDEMRAAAMLL